MIYIITHFEQFTIDETERILKMVLPMGIHFVQYRNKKEHSHHYSHYASRLQYLCNLHDVPLIINDNYQLAVTLNAQGVHVGQTDTSVDVLRKNYRYKGIIGATAKDVQQAILAERTGADYLGVGALFPSLTKSQASPLSLDELKEIRKSTKLPIFAIGGLTPSRLSSEIIDHIDGVCFSHSLWSAKDPKNIIKSFQSYFST